MRNHTVRASLCALIAGTMLNFATPVPARAQWTVIDPTNLAQNVLQVSHAIEQINNQIRQIEQQAAMLARSPLQLSPELARSIDDARAAFDAAQSVQFEADRVGDQLRTLYPETYARFDLEEVLGRSDQWMTESRASLQAAIQAEARASASLRESQGRIDTALAASANAEGQTGAQQASNQLLGVQATQLAEIQALLAAQGRALQIERMESLARETRASEIRRRAFPTERDAPPPARTAF